jgi:hypothetical protein
MMVPGIAFEWFSDDGDNPGRFNRAPSGKRKMGAVDSDHDLGVSKLSKHASLPPHWDGPLNWNPQGIHVSEHSPVKIPK